MSAENIEKIFNAYKERKDIEKYSHLASFEEIKENDLTSISQDMLIPSRKKNLSILDEVFKEYQDACKEESDLNETLNGYFKELGLNIKLEV